MRRRAARRRSGTAGRPGQALVRLAAERRVGRAKVLAGADVVCATLSAGGPAGGGDHVAAAAAFGRRSAEPPMPPFLLPPPRPSPRRLGSSSAFLAAPAAIRFCVLVDEAAQATEPSCLVPLKFGAEKLILVGDPRQLPGKSPCFILGPLPPARVFCARLARQGTGNKI